MIITCFNQNSVPVDSNSYGLLNRFNGLLFSYQYGFCFGCVYEK